MVKLTSEQIELFCQLQESIGQKVLEIGSVASKRFAEEGMTLADWSINKEENKLLLVGVDERDGRQMVYELPLQRLYEDNPTE